MCCQYLDKFIDEYNKHDWSYAAALDDSAGQVTWSDKDEQTLVLCVRSVQKLQSHCLPLTPYDRNLANNLQCDTTSKALLKSM